MRWKGSYMRFLVLLVILVPGCATKHYGRLGKLTEHERTTLTCREIDVEIAQVRGFRAHIEEEKKFDARSVLSFLGDFGIGNLMERKAAEDSANTRMRELEDLQQAKGCATGATTTLPPAGPSESVSDGTRSDLPD